MYNQNFFLKSEHLDWNIFIEKFIVFWYFLRRPINIFMKSNYSSLIMDINIFKQLWDITDK